MKKNLKKNLQGRFYLDGGTGSSLIAAGLNDPHTELYNITRPDVIEKLQTAYFKAGSNAVTTNTFGCNSLKADLTEHSLREIITAATNLSRKVADCFGGYVLYDCGPSGALLQPNGNMTFDEAYELFAEQARIVRDCDVDGVIIETFGDLQEMRAAFLAFSENTDLPILCSMTFEKTGRTFTGTSVESFALTMTSLGASAVGINCGTGAKDMIENAKRLVKCTQTPVFVQPNAGLPRFENGKTVYDTDADTFAAQMREICRSGVDILGGCCGTTPDFIVKTVAATEAIRAAKRTHDTDGVCSFSRVTEFGKKSIVIGERVNPTGKPRLKQAILEKDYDYILSVCLAEMQEGADVLDINLGTPGCDEEEELAKAVAFLQGVADLPLCIDTAKPAALEKAVRVACGRVIINSVNGSEDSMNKVFPIAKKYGSYVVALCLDENGIPETTNERIAVAKRILARGKEYGIDQDRFLFDPLTMAVSVRKDNALVTLETLKRLRVDLGVKTTLGLSNVSFGLPNRQILNGVFYQMALEADTSSAIINPTLRPLSDEVCRDLLTGKDDGCEKYLEKFGLQEETKAEEEKELKACIVKGLVGKAREIAERTVTADNYAVAIEEDVIGGLNELGKRFSDGRVFLPQLIAGSEAAKAALDFIKNKFIPEGASSKATVVLATVRGDVHDIGKNIVKAVVSNYGYRIIDLGKDVPEETILDAVEREKPQVVGLSALMTTTLDSMEKTAKLLAEKHPEVLVMVGGAVVTEEFADKIGALYTKDAQEMAAVLQKRFS